MRQNFKDHEYFTRYINLNRALYENGLLKVKENKVNPEMINWYKKSLLDKLLDLTISYYTNGSGLNVLVGEFDKILDYIEESWLTDVVKLQYKNKIYNQYTFSSYSQMLWMLSLAYLLNVSESDFNKLVKLIDRDGVKDILFEFIIRAKIKDRVVNPEETYKDYFHIPTMFSKVRQAIVETEKVKMQSLVNEYVTKEWYKNLKKTGWYNSHKNIHETYFGYWSFETAAVVKFMKLDDSCFINCQYYPKDLVHSK